MQKLLLGICIILVSCSADKDTKQNVIVKPHKIGDVLDSLNGVYVYYNGSFRNTGGRNVTSDGYNLGIKYQCVEFVKRYYYEHLHHKMPETYGDAKDFFDPGIKDGQLNKQRGLLQFTNPSISKPIVGDLLVMGGTRFNPFGHACIVTKVENMMIEIIQQNPGPHVPSRKNYVVVKKANRYMIGSARVLGWLRKNN